MPLYYGFSPEVGTLSYRVIRQYDAKSRSLTSLLLPSSQILSSRIGSGAMPLAQRQMSTSSQWVDSSHLPRYHLLDNQLFQHSREIKLLPF